MRRIEVSTLPSVSRRGAFTLIELLIVIAIIAALLALSAAGVIKFVGSQQRANTISLLDKTQSQLNKAWSAEKDAAMKEAIPPSVLWAMLAGSDANATNRTRVIYVKLRMRQAFPMSFKEALNATVPTSPLGPLPSYVATLNKLGITAGVVGRAGYVPQPYESSVCLLMALQRARSGGGVDATDLTAGGATGSATLPSPPFPAGQNVTFLTDAWGAPLYFSRFPTGSSALNPSGALPGNNDPGDPQGYLNSTTWAQQDPQGQTMFSQLALQQLAPASNPPLSYKLAPMIASSGPDKTPQFNPITFALTTPDSDDLFSTP